MDFIPQSRIVRPEDRAVVKDAAFRKYFGYNSHQQIPPLRGYSQSDPTKTVWLHKADGGKWEKLERDSGKDSWSVTYGSYCFSNGNLNANNVSILERVFARFLENPTQWEFCSYRVNVFTNKDKGKVAVIFGSQYQSANSGAPGYVRIGWRQNTQFFRDVRLEVGSQNHLPDPGLDDLRMKNTYSMVVSLDQKADMDAYATAKFMNNLGINVSLSLVDQKSPKKKTPYKGDTIKALSDGVQKLTSVVGDRDREIQQYSNALKERDSRTAELQEIIGKYQAAARLLKGALSNIEQTADDKRWKGSSTRKILKEAKEAIEKFNATKLA